MLKSKQLSQYLLNTAMVSIVSIACTHALSDYTQLTFQATSNTTVVDAQALEQTQKVLENRLAELALGTVKVETQTPNRILVRLPQGSNIEDLAASLIISPQFTMRSQKPDTEAELTTLRSTLQQLISEQEILQQSNQQVEAEALQPQIDETRGVIASLFGPAEITGAMLRDTQAEPTHYGSGNLGQINVQFDEIGTAKFAEVTRAIAGTGRTLGIFFDDVLLSAPIVSVAYADSGILGGSAVISGNLTLESAMDLALQIRSGTLPLNLELVSVTASEDTETQN